MNSREKRSEIIELINNIKEHSDRLADRPNMPLLEISAILSKINKLHETTVVLKYLLAREQNHEEEFQNELFLPKKREEEIEEVLTQEKKNEEERILDLEDSKEKDFPNSNEVESIVAEKTIMDTKNEEQLPVSKDILENLPGLDQLGKIDLNEQYSSSEDNRLEEKLNKMPIIDLLPSIGLNERYLYANDLFDGDMELFKTELQKLNEFSTLEEAFTYWEVLAVKMDWEEDNTLVKALRNLIDRRFSS